MAERMAEDEITPRQRELIAPLLQESFPGYPQRSYFKQLPQFRLVDWQDDAVRAHVGIEHRVIRAGDAVLRIFGLIDLCVAASARSQGVASRLLAEVEDLGRSAGIDAVVLVADDTRLYRAAGFVEVTEPARWLMINEHESLGIAERPVDGLMAKPLGPDPWPPGPIDLLGYLF